MNKVLFESVFQTKKITIFGTEKEPQFCFQEIMMILGYEPNDRFFRRWAKEIVDQKHSLQLYENVHLENSEINSSIHSPVEPKKIDKNNEMIAWKMTFEILCSDLKSEIAKSFRNHLFDLYEELRLKNINKI
jgi:hypothetical protein